MSLTQEEKDTIKKYMAPTADEETHDEEFNSNFMGKEKVEEVKKNAQVFFEHLDGLMKTHKNKHALMRHGQVIDYLDTSRDAMILGDHLYEDNMFSVQHVTDEVVELGYQGQLL